MKRGANRKRRDIQFDVGDLVYLNLRPYRRKTLAVHPNEKLAPRFYGPFEIVQRVGPIAYKLALPAHCHIHPVFHVSQLREARGEGGARVDIPHQLNADLEG